MRSTLVIHKQTAHTAATRLIWMAMIFNSSETIVDYFQLVGHYRNVQFKNLLEVKWVVRANPLEPLLPTGLLSPLFQTLHRGSVAQQC